MEFGYNTSCINFPVVKLEEILSSITTPYFMHSNTGKTSQKMAVTQNVGEEERRNFCNKYPGNKPTMTSGKLKIKQKITSLQ